MALPHLDAAHNLARWLVRDAALAEDVVQDAMLRALTYFETVRGDNPRGWLLRIVRTVAYDRLASQSARPWVPLDDALPDSAESPEAVAAQAERHETLGHALEALPPELREAIVLRELEELSYRDIAGITGVPVGTVMSRLWRARQALRRYGEAIGA
jgi:RNA polymerase sigma-70 factor (ECF subfamily)